MNTKPLIAMLTDDKNYTQIANDSLTERFLRIYKSSTSNIINPLKDFKKHLELIDNSYMGHDQHDAYETLGTILDIMHQEAAKVYDGKDAVKYDYAPTNFKVFNSSLC